MADIAASVLARLKNKATESGKSYQLCLQLFCQEEFLLRKIPNTPEQLKPILEEIIEVPTGNEFVSFDIIDIAPISVAKKYAGIGASIVHTSKTPVPRSVLISA